MLQVLPCDMAPLDPCVRCTGLGRHCVLQESFRSTSTVSFLHNVQRPFLVGGEHAWTVGISIYEQDLAPLFSYG